ncbi:MAG: 2-amino-4-hydroxy-6-hydroxymethyldihydropteridine diphosphokinase [Limnospira sp. PMC 894.15]|uniref:2-amino-4-hydroxy-6-hydroxymethyldihydropteridine diphosphokinase n=1 Tax=Limnospira fusiformis PMC 851.14 TaxID=2219512 RepID=A0ABU9EKH9_LIMFS|nr:2-amino-4-hydroxy-6-hydroxymethyldihydropteridine diphosphokinase [Limnospira sp. PMC 894.15]MDT9190818.1 2-amino-4-hydroxy-6-hydroxymethyldihydropteridine diphosphokinase [Limnospira sp. PMC 894.15]
MDSNVAIGLGSNLGLSGQTVETALELLGGYEGIRVKKRSHWYRTIPVGPPQPDYINGCAILEVTVSPQSLLETLLEIEKILGRVRGERWGPRTLDLDLLLFDDLILNTPTLEIPHPRMRDRAFVLVPLAEIAPEWIDPISKKAIAQLLETIDQSGVQKLTLTN